jgi:hypothetical protein
VLISGETGPAHARLTGMLRFLALLFVAVPAVAAEVVVHLDLSDSMRAGLADGTVRAIRVELAAQPGQAQIVETKGPVAVLSDVDAGSWRLRTFLIVRGATYIVDPRGLEVDVAPNVRNDVVVPVPALLVAGTMSLHGKPFHGTFLTMPWKPARASWTLTVPVDAQGRFAFPLPWAGDWTLQLYRRLGEPPAAVTRTRFRGSGDVRIDVE